ncbi:condensation domain-containing protein [Streptomyces sp. NPDC047860]|uniref:condensation domain-containing protein n=1 Tax=Streptomyces sp. NPDC047860 TaxID=3155743 RepID=UPI0033EDCF0F
MAHAGPPETDAPTRADRSSPLPVSHAQRGMWLAQQVGGGDDRSLTIHQVYRLAGPLDAESLARAFEAVVERHEVLRTGFAVGGADLVQVIAAPSGPAMPVVEVRDSEPWELLVRAFLDEPFDLERGPLLRARLFREDEENNVLAVAVHHIAADGWSMGILHQELAALYRVARTAGPVKGGDLVALADLPELPVQYADYAAWQRELAESGEEYEESLAVWRARLAGAPPLTGLPTDRPRSGVRVASGGRVRAVLTAEQAAVVARTAAAHGTTAFTVCFAAFQALLAARSDQYDVVTGVTVANRALPETESLIGFLVNVLPIRTRHTPTTTFTEFLGLCADRLREAYEHDMPLELLLEKLDIPRASGLKPLIQITVAAQQDAAGLHLDGLRVEHLPPERRHVHDDLTLYVGTVPDGGVVEVDYPSSLFEHATVAALARTYVRLLAAVGEDADQPLDVLVARADAGSAP